MKNIGMFFEKRSEVIEAYRKHSQQSNNMARDFGTVIVNPAQMTITCDDVCWMYYAFESFEDAVRISGINFAAVICEISDRRIKDYIMTRLRPFV